MAHKADEVVDTVSDRVDGLAPDRVIDSALGTMTVVVPDIGIQTVYVRLQTEILKITKCTVRNKPSLLHFYIFPCSHIIISHYVSIITVIKKDFSIYSLFSVVSGQYLRQIGQY